MNLKQIFITGLLCLAGQESYAAVLSGKIVDRKGVPLSGVSVSLLYPSDSTLVTFAITNKEGTFSINDAAEEHYVMQVAIAGYYTEYEQVGFVAGETRKLLPSIVLEKNIDEQKLKEVVISGERVPVSIKGDTVEYNAGSYRVKPNAPVEDLLRQLPGVQVDEKGNIKSMGKDVKKILVDGKEFFGTDPKIATKNLPADAIDKIQTFGKHSDESLFSGIDDGSREQTINLKLKAGKRKGYFGDVKAGAGTKDHFDVGGKIFQFRPKTQLAALGTMNNINQFGFSFEDYVNFNGGIGNLINGGSMSNIEDAPVDFGQPVTGKNTTGALGLNYSVELRPKNRFSINYISNGLSKTEASNTYAKNYLPSGDNYITQSRETLKRESFTNNIAANWNNQVDSLNQLIFSFNAQVKNVRTNDHNSSNSSVNEELINQLNAYNTEKGQSGKLNTTASWVHKLRNENWKIIRSSATVDYLKENVNYDWNNSTHYTGTSGDVLSHQFQLNENKTLRSGFNIASARRLWKDIYVEPKWSAAYNDEVLHRYQGNADFARVAIDSLSPQVQNKIYALAPGISIKNGSTKQQWNFGLEARKIWMNPVVNSTLTNKSDFQYLLPSAFWRRELGQSKSLEFSYNTKVQTPQPKELLPVLYYSSPLSGIRGDLALKPEYQHNVYLNYMHFDQFEMSSLFASINGSYIKDKIGTAVTVMPNLSQQAQWVNTAYAANLSFNGSYSRPLRKLGIDIKFDLNEMVQLSESPVNNVANKNTALTHRLGFAINNRKQKDKWNARLGADVQIADSRYSINKEYNNVFYNYTGFAYLSYQPTKKWFLSIDAKVKYYTAQSFDKAISIPLLGAELTRYILPQQRASVSLKAFDLLNRNQSVIRQGLYNNLVEQTATVLKRYFLLSFTYKLTKVGS